MASSSSWQWNGATEHAQLNDGDHDAPSDSEDDYWNAQGKRTWWERKALGSNSGLGEPTLQRQRVEGRQHLDPEIRFFKLNTVDEDYKDNHSRIPDLSADIRVVFSSDGEEYTGAYISHGRSKTVFVIRSCSRKKGRFDGAVLKISRKHDIEPDVMRQVQELTPKLFYECMGKDGRDEYHCWVIERCIPLNRLAVLQSTCNKQACVLAACRCIAKAALRRLLLSDCHYYNFGLRRTGNEKEHEVVIIDVGSRGIAKSVPAKADVNLAMNKLWRWSKEEIQASTTSTHWL